MTHPPLSPDEIERYARHLVLAGIGGPGQQKLKRARVLIVGAGGIGSPAALYLAAAGVGTLGLVDDDRVSLANLQRQILHSTARIGAAKTESARKTLAALNPHVTIIPHTERLTAANATAIIAGYDMVLDGSDSFITRHLVADACHLGGRTLVSAAVIRFQGQLGVFTGRPCYRCLVPEAPPGDGMACEEVGVLGAAAGVMGAWAAAEAVKLITGAGAPLIGRLMVFDALAPAVRIVTVPADPACALCGENVTICDLSAHR
jgi:molybdopterin/thiamine biosynthesis adenylyltransferase